MITRCYNQNRENWKYYGGKGITVCKRWRNYDRFYDDMGPRPKGKTLDRKSNHIGYRPSNCKWSTWREQQNNKSLNHWITFKGKTMSASDWSRQLGINVGTLISRFQKGWPVRRAMTEPIHWKGQVGELKKQSKGVV